jgi:hypothetical protein
VFEANTCHAGRSNRQTVALNQLEAGRRGGVTLFACSEVPSSSGITAGAAYRLLCQSTAEYVP